MMASLPFGAAPDDLGEFLLGRVSVTPVLLESNGAIDRNQLDWTPEQKSVVLQNITEGLQWWKDLLATKSSTMQLDWVIDTTYLNTPVETSFEPITRTSNEYVRWVPEFLDHVGFGSTTNIDTGIRQFNQSQRLKNDTDWSFTIFVVNSAPNQLFATGGSFSRAFAFAGGLYFVTPSNRPASTYTHETGHMFWARDEYQGGGNYYQSRGYYNSQNLNAIDLNPTPNFQQSLSIMSSGDNLLDAYNTLTTSPATLAQIGWQDSDGDGIFDVLDVPLQLEGVGRFEPATNTYRFTGKAAAKALPNRNSSGLQNDITLNKVGLIAYRFDDNSAWMTAATINRYTADLELSISVPVGTTGIIQIRAIDPRTGITSAIYRGSVNGTDLTTEGGISGFVWSDTINDGQRNITEPGLAGWNVQVVDANGAPRDIQTKIEPDLMPLGVLSSNAFPGSTLSSIGLDADGTLGVSSSSIATTGTKIFIPYSPITQTFREGWRDDDQRLRIGLSTLQSAISVDVIGIDSVNYGRLDVYSSSGVLLERVTSTNIAAGRSQSLSISRTTADISYAMVSGHLGTRVGIDNIRVGPVLKTVTGPQGEYRLPGLAPGSYSLQVTPINDLYAPVSPITGRLTAFVNLQQATPHVDFGFYREPSDWQNVVLNYDVDGDGNVFPVDALLVINELNRSGVINLVGSSIPTTSKIDVNGDHLLSPLDALLIINYLNQLPQGFQGEGEFPGPVPIQPPAPGDGEEPPVGYETLYLGDDNESIGIAALGEIPPNENPPESALLVLVGSSSATPPVEPNRRSPFDEDLLAPDVLTIDLAFGSLFTA